MKIFRPQIMFLLVIFIAMSVYAGIANHTKRVIGLEITNSGDTAQVSLLHALVGVDSFNYIDTFSYQADTTAHQTITWLSPLQVARITVPIADSSTVYSCSIGFAADTLGFDVDPSDDHNTIAKIVDTLVYLFNNTTNLTDSVVAEDSVTYVKIVSMFSQLTLTDRFEVQFGVTGGAGTLDTSASTVVTVAMISDSMPAYINADAGLDSFLTAANLNDTGYTVTSDDKGVLFEVASVTHADTGGSLVAFQANVTSWSSRTDTFRLAQTIFDKASHTSMYGVFILNASTDTLKGVGKSDSGYIWLYSGFNINNNTAREYTLLAVDTGIVPCTLRYAQADNDTLLKEALYIVWRVADTASDTTLYVPSYDLTLDYNLYEK